MNQAIHTPKRAHRILAVLLTLAMVITLLPNTLLLQASAETDPQTETDTPASSSCVVYVGNTDSGSGTEESPYQTLDEAYAYIAANAPTEGGTIVICGAVTVTGTFSAEDYGISGTVALTSKLSEDKDFTSTGKLTLSGDSTTLALSDKTIMENLNIVLAAASSSKSLFLYTGLDLQIGAGMNIDGTGNLKVFCAKTTSTAGEAINVTVSSGTYHTFFLGGNTGSTNGNVNLTINNDVKVLSNVTIGPNSTKKSPSSSGNLNFTMNGGEVKVIYNTPNTNGTTGDAVINLNNGTLTDAMRYYGTGTTMNSVTVNLSGSFDAVPSTFGDWTAGTVTNGTTLNLVGFNGALSDSAADDYDILNITDHSHVIYSSSLPDKMSVCVAADNTLTLKNYTSADELPEGVTISGEGEVYYGSEEKTYLSVAYVDGTLSASGDGKTPETAFLTLQEAVKALDPAVGGTVVLCGEVRIESLVNLESFDVTGPVILTSVYGGSDYRTTGAKLTWVGDSQNLVASGNMVIDSVTFHMESTEATTSQFIYSGLNLTITDSVVTTGTGRMKIFVAKYSPSAEDNCSAYVAGGTYNQIYVGSNAATSGDATLTISGNASVSSNVAMGGNGKGNTMNNVTFNMEGGYVKVIYDISNGGTVKGDVVMNLTGGSITEMRDYNGKSGIVIEGNITVNVDSAFSCGTAQFGVWSGGVVTVSGSKTLNLVNYQGTGMNSLTNYDVVNIFGDHIPADFQSSGVKGSMNAYDYTGILGLSLSGYHTFTATGNGSYVTFLGTVPTTDGTNPTKLVANDGATLCVRTSTNPGVTRDDFVIEENGTGKVLLDDPAYVGLETILQVDFDDKTATDNSGKGNNGVISGDPTFVEGYDGNTAVYTKNTFGKNKATQYVTFSDLKGIDLTTDDYTISFWYQTVNGGHEEWARAGKATTAGSDVNMHNVKAGGVVFSNQDTAQDTSGMSAIQLPQSQYLTMGLTDGSGAHHDVDGIRDAMDDRWHMITVTYDRNGSYKVYVDDSLVVVKDISGLSGQKLGENALVLGADVAHQYGLENAYIDNVTLYKGAMLHTDVLANYCVESLTYLTNNVDNSLSALGSEYDAYKADMATLNNTVKTTSAKYTAADYKEAKALYSQLYAAYMDFLAAPQDDAKLSALLISDIHITAENDVDSQRLELLFADLVANGLVPDLMINGGDFADNSKAETTQAAYTVFNNLVEKYSLDDMLMIAAFGNHEIGWDSATSNYLASTPVYWENIMAHIQSFVDEGKATIDSINYDAELYATTGESHSHSYAVTYNGYHFVVFNTDYKLQTGCSKEVLDENGNYSIEGNELDPIRHGVYLEEDTLEWLNTRMENYSKDGLPIFVVNHFPFIDTCPLSYYDEIVINDNSIGAQDAQIRKILASYDDVFYFCGHLHSSFGMVEPVEVVSEGVGSFIEMNLPAIKGASRAYANVPASWLMYVYADEIVLRARDFTTGEWLPEYDTVLPLSTSSCQHKTLTKVDAKAATTEAEGNIEYYVCESCGKLFSDAEGTKEIQLADTVIAKLPATDSSPATADSFLPAILALLTLSMGAVILLGTKKKYF